MQNSAQFLSKIEKQKTLIFIGFFENGKGGLFRHQKWSKIHSKNLDKTTQKSPPHFWTKISQKHKSQ